ncbi:MAG TPA: histidine--tRNA ligase [Flavitalea sp.]|nr:histidine--tRNA ligase [Flavitalea sp.]
MSIKVSLPQGTRDFGPEVVRKRNYILDAIRYVFELSGFQPLETPALENLETLTGKYGDEGDKLIFKILNNGLSDPKNTEKATLGFQSVLQGKNDSRLTERALKYDLTIPFARYVAMNHGQLALPFKRYQIQPVWRADRPQRGRYREFVQCDADVVGSKSLINEVELANIYAIVFRKLGIDVEIRINSRKILAALAGFCGGAQKLTDITIAIDKLDKIGINKVKEELVERGLNSAQVETIGDYLGISGNNRDKIKKLLELLPGDTLQAGISELEYLLDYPGTAYQGPLMIDLTLARGLNYYTGLIFEVKARNVQMGSIGGGGRYDDLTGLFGVPGIPGVGISFGVDRIYDVMEELNLFPKDVKTGTQVVFFNLGEAESKTAFGLMQQLRVKGIRCELYPEPVKMDKQFKYAEKKQIPYAVIIGSKELQEQTCLVRNLGTKEQQSLPLLNIIDFNFI